MVRRRSAREHHLMPTSTSFKSCFFALAMLSGCKASTSTVVAPASCPETKTVADQAPTAVENIPVPASTTSPTESVAELLPKLKTVLDVQPSSARPARIDFDRGTILLELFEAGDPLQLAVRVRIDPDDGSDSVVHDRVTSLTGCDTLVFGLDPILRDDEFVIVDARLDCLNGSEILQIRAEHTVVAVTLADGQSTILYTGHSEFNDNRRLAVSSTRLEFYVEAGELAVYRHDVAWCDRRALRTLMDDPDVHCARRGRTLREVERIRVPDGLAH